MPAAPSLLIVPYRSKTGRLYSQIPVPVAPATTGAGDFNVTRNTEARRFNSAGLIESVASGIPRLDYYTSGGTAGCPALLVEPAATNLVPSGTVYTALASALVSAVTDTPAIGVSGALCTKNTASGSTAYIRQSFSAVALSSGTTYSVSRFFKYNGVAFNTTLEAEGSTQWGGVAFKQVVVLSAASGVTLGASTLCTGSVENFGNGWYRVNARVTTGATIGGSANVTILSELPAALSTGQGFLTACPQLETGSVATSYIPTPAGSASRSADVISVTGAVSGSIGQTEGTIYAEVDIRNLTDGRIFTLFNSPTRYILLSKATNRLGGVVIDSPTTIVNLQTASGSLTAGTYKIALAYASGDFAFYVNGTQVATSATGGVIGGYTTLMLGNFTSSLFFNDRIRAAALYTTRLTNAELATLTAP